MRPIARQAAVPLLAALAWLAPAGRPASAQDACETALQAAQRSYDLGLFEDVPAQLTPCLGGRASRSQFVSAHALLAKTWLALDEMDQARDAVLELLRVDSAYEPGPPPRFAALVAEVRRRDADLQVATVSKTSESLREAPATVAVLTAEEIARRGYLDLEQVLHDLPGFDVSRTNGETYSTFYQRGFRAKDNDRILLLVDGVEQNDLSSGVLHLSRQYPIATVERVEVVYGPSSTIYGANAFSGVINVLTKPPESFVPEGKRFGTLVQAAGGSFGTGYTDLALAGRDRAGSVAWSLSGRLFRSDEPDLSEFPTWDYDYSSVDYVTTLRLLGLEAESFCGVGEPFSCRNDPGGTEPLFRVLYNEEGTPLLVEPTAAGVRLAREADRALGLAYADDTEDWSLYGRLRLGALAVGLHAWRREEGSTPGFLALEQAPGSWSPEHTSLSIKYARSLGRSLSISLFTRYQQNDLDAGASGRSLLFTYANGALDLGDLRDGCSRSGENEVPCPAAMLQLAPPGQLASQSAAEVNLIYAPRRELTLLGGLDLKKGTIQTHHTLLGFVLVNEVVDHTDVGLYLQGSYKPRPTLSLVAGGRLDSNTAQSSGFPDTGFGTLFSPRLAVVYLPGRWTFKAIYAEAFKNPSDFEKLSLESGLTGLTPRRANPDLEPERTKSVELSAAWSPADGTAVELAAYRARYSGLVGLGFICEDFLDEARPCPPQPDELFAVSTQFQNLLDMEVDGVELSARTRLGRLTLFGNATFVDPRGTPPPLRADPTAPLPETLVGDIARRRANLGLELPLWQRLGFHLRWNYVGARRTGAGTTVTTNPLGRVDAYSVAHATLTYDGLPGGATLQLIANNLFDEDYAHPGVSAADGLVLSASVPQPGRAFYARVTWGLGRMRAAGGGEP